MSSIYQFINTRHCYRRMGAHGCDRDHIALVVEHNRFKKQTTSVGKNYFCIANSPGIYRPLHLCQLCRNISHWILLQWVRGHGCHDTNRYENIVLSTALAKARHGTDAELTNTAHHQYSDIVTASKVIANWTVCSTTFKANNTGYVNNMRVCCEGNQVVIGGFPSQRASNADNVSMSCFIDELWFVSCEYLGINGPCYNGTVLHLPWLWKDFLETYEQRWLSWQ